MSEAKPGSSPGCAMRTMTAATHAASAANDGSQDSHVRTETFDINRNQSMNDDVDRTGNKTVFGDLDRHIPIDLGDVPQADDLIEITYKYSVPGEKYEYDTRTRSGRVTHNPLQGRFSTARLAYMDDENDTEYYISTHSYRRRRPPRRDIGTPVEVAVHYTEYREQRRARLLDDLNGRLEKYDHIDDDVPDDDKSIQHRNLEALADHNEKLVESEGKEFVVRIEERGRNGRPGEDVWEEITSDRFDDLVQAERLVESVDDLEYYRAHIEREEQADDDRDRSQS